MDEFTKDELHRIDLLYGNDFQDATPDDFKLIARWEQHKVREDAEMQARIAAIEKESAARVKETTKTEKLAREILNEKAQRSRERWEALRNG